MDTNNYFGDELDKLKFGFCEVNIPRGHIQGELERPFSLWFIKFSEESGQHVVVESIEQYEEKVFMDKFSSAIDSIKDKAALVFIPGYNTTFAEAARRTAQIAWDIPFNGISGFFSWPSSGNLAHYFKEIEHADASVPVFGDFLEKILYNTQVEKLHLIGHSMGNRLLFFTLNNLSDKSSFESKLKIINQIVLAAPDIDQNVFLNTILPKFQKIGNQRTLYASDKDNALHLSENFRNGLSRLGDASESLFVSEGLDTIDASNVKSNWLGHSYIFDTKELLSDLFYLLGKGLKPEERRLRPRKKKNLIYWLFPK